MSTTNRFASCWHTQKIKGILSRFVSMSQWLLQALGTHLARLDRFPTSLLWVSGFRAAGRQSMACESSHSPDQDSPVTNPPFGASERRLFLIPASSFIFVPAFSFSTFMSVHTLQFIHVARIALLWISVSQSLFSLSQPFSFLSHLQHSQPIFLSQCVLTEG